MLGDIVMQEFKVALKAIIRKDGKILVLKRSDKEEVFTELWDIPGGRINFGELPVAALEREIMEETGLLVNVGEPFTVWSFMASAEKQVVGITLLADYISGEVLLSDEHTDYAWISPKDFSNFNANKNLKAEIAKYSNNV